MDPSPASANIGPPQTRFHSLPDDSTDDVIEISAMDCPIPKRKKRAKVVPHDVIEIDEDEDLSNSEKVNTGKKGKEKLKGYDQNWVNPVKEALASEFMGHSSADVGMMNGFHLNPLKSSTLASNSSTNFNGGFFQNGLYNSSYYDDISYNAGAFSLQSQYNESNFPPLESSIPFFDEPASIYDNPLDVSTSSFSNQLNASLYMGKDNNEIWMPKPIESHKKPATVNMPNTPCQSRCTREQDKEEDEVLKKFRLFKRFETVHDHSDHHFTTRMSSKSNQPPRNCWAKKIQQEWKILEKDLPDTIYVRVYEERMDLLRAVIVGAAGTPYHDSLFFFDVFFPPDYPNKPPQVYYHSGGLRLNPNLYNCGKVCLSLLNTWHGSKEEKWTPKKSTVLQVLLSIQALVLNAKPFFNEPGYANMAGSNDGEKRSQDYNENTYILSCKTMLYTIRRPPKHFEDFIEGHFREHAHVILVACKAYMEGAQVGCLVGGVQDLEEGDKSSSQNFRVQVGQIVQSLVPAFTQIGAKDCEQFLPQTNNNRYGGDSTLLAHNSNAFPTLANKPIFTPANTSFYTPTGFSFY